MRENAMHEVVGLLSKFGVDKLGSNWVRDVIDSDFTEVEDFPVEFEQFHGATNFKGLFHACVGSCRQWIDTLPAAEADIAEKRLSITGSPDKRLSTTGSPQARTSMPGTPQASGEQDLHTSFWVALSENVNLKGLKSLLFYFIHRGQRYDAREAERELGIKACSLYFLLLCVPGSNAFRVFHPVLYLKTIEVLKLTTKLKVAVTSPSKKTQGRQGGSRGSSRKSHDDAPYGEEEEEDAEVVAMLTAAEASVLVRSLNILLNDILRLLRRFSLKHSSDCLDETINILIDVSRCEIRYAQGIFLGRHGPSTVTALSYNAYVGLQFLCNPLHGKISKIVILIMKHIMYNILMIPRGSSDLSNRALGVIREHSQIFVKYMLTQVKEEAFEGVYILIQHICIRVPDKSEYRQKAAQSVVEILRYLPIQLYTRLVKWFFKFSHNEKASHRLFMLEVIAKMLDEKERVGEGNENTPNSVQENSNENRAPSPTSSESTSDSDTDQDDEGANKENSFMQVNVDHSTEAPNNRNILSHKFLLGIIFSRCRDSGATVRAKALTLLAECTYSQNPTIILAMKHIFFRNRPSVFNTPHIPNNGVNLESPLDIESDENVNMPNASMIVAMLHRRALDDKVTVRKSALQVLENLMKLDNEMLSVKNLEVLAEHCRDPALLIRKQMISSLAGLVDAYPENVPVITAFIKGVFPLVLDPEMKVQEKVVECIDNLLFRRIVPHKHHLEGTPEKKLPWLIVSTITKLTFHKFFNKILMQWSKSELKRPQVVRVVQTYIGTDNNEEMWTLLSSLSNYINVSDATFVVDYFEEQCESGSMVGSYTLQQVLKVLGNSIKYIPGNRGESLQERLLRPVTTYSVGVQLISPMMDTITLLTYSMHGDEEAGQKAIEKWVAPILKSCDDYLKTVLFEKSVSVEDDSEEKLFRRLFTLGEASLLCPHKVNRRMFLMLQSLIFQQSGRERTRSATRIPSSQTQSSQPTAITFKPSARVQALSVVTLGKMCLQHEEQAKRIIPVLGKMLDTPISSEMKVNIVFVLSDMCVRYATVVDPLMPQVTACLRDPDLNVRRTTLTLLINLLQEDYLKLKGSFFYRILQCLTDDHEDVRSTVIFYVTERLLKRFPKILCQHFIECIFHYNCYEEHESYNRFNQSSVEKELFSLSGKDSMQDRLMIYKFMLDQMPDDQRFTTTQRLCQDVLGAVVDGRIKLTPSSVPMLEDTLTVLRSDEIKLASLKSKPEDADQPTDQAEQAAMAGMVIKKTIISQVVKRNVIENIVPILIALKNKLEEKKSPLMKHLLLYIKEIMKDYKNEVKEILAGDKQLAKEIEFDLRRFDLEEEELQRKAAEEKEKEKNLEEEAGRQEEAAEQEEADNVVDDDAGSKKNDANKLSLGASPAHIKKNVPGTPLNIPAGNRNELHRQALMHSKAVTERRRSSIVPVAFNLDSGRDSEIQDDGSGVTESGMQKSSAEPPKMPHKEGNVAKKAAADNVAEKAVADNVAEKAVADNVAEKAGPDNVAEKAAADDNNKVSNTEDDKSEKESCEKEKDSVVDEIEKDVQLDDTHVDPRPIGQEESVVSPQPGNRRKSVAEETRQKVANAPMRPVMTPRSRGRPKKMSREDLLRAISTPQHRPSVISNITFMDETQDVSAITVHNASAPLEAETNKQPKLILHLQSPEAFAKESEFSRLRKGSKNLEGKDIIATDETNQSAGQEDSVVKRGLFTSHSSEATEDNSDESACDVEKTLKSKKDFGKQKAKEDRGNVKRKRDVASLSPVVSRTSPRYSGRKPAQKKK